MTSIRSTVLAVSVAVGAGLLSDHAGAQSSAGAPLESTLRPGSIQLVSKAISENNPKLQYTIEVGYPQIEGAPNPKEETFNREIEALAQKQVNEFSKTVAVPDPNLPGADVGSSLDISYTVALSSDKLISVGFDASTYSSGAAHPQHYSFVYNYDLREGRKLDLGDLFEPRANYLSVISDYCVKALARTVSQPPDTDWIGRGAGPIGDNYQRWLVTPHGLKITFDPYQVAPYVDGPQEVVVPYTALKGLIGARSPIAEWAKPKR